MLVTGRRRNAFGSFIAPGADERAEWPAALAALDMTINNAAVEILHGIAPNACRTADLDYNRDCRVPARLDALKRLADGDWAWPFKGVTGAAETSPEAQTILAQNIVEASGLEGWTFDPDLYRGGGPWEPVVIAADVPGGGVVNLRIMEDGSFDQPEELTARALRWGECEDMEREVARRGGMFNVPGSGRYGNLPGQLPIPTEEDVEACKAEVRQMPFPRSSQPPGMTWIPPDEEDLVRDATTGDVTETITSTEDDSADVALDDEDVAAEDFLARDDLTEEEREFFEDLAQDPEAWDRWWHPWRYDPKAKPKKHNPWLWLLGGLTISTVIGLAVRSA